MSIQGPWLYLGGNFTRISGGTGFNFAGPLTLSRLARARLTDGRPDWNWEPTLETAPMDINASAQGDRLCSALSTSSAPGAYQFVPATTLTDVAGNAAAPTTITAASQVIF